MNISAKQLHPSWHPHLEPEFQKEYMAQLKSFLIQEQKNDTIFPRASDIFTAFKVTPFDKVKVVILGQDPYHGSGQAHGLCFSTQKTITPPPSLVNIFKEIERDLGIPRPIHGCLDHWASQGVFLLNTILTVKEASPLSHAQKGWETFTDFVIQSLSGQRENLIFVLWGKPAQKKKSMINHNKHLILTAPHPSPLSAYRGFHGCGHFSAINQHLESLGESAIDWNLPT
jgi:uracil-DNA glycosylase